MKRTFTCFSLVLMLLPLIGTAQNPCLTENGKAIQSFFSNFNTTVEVGEIYSGCVKIPSPNIATLGVQSATGEGTLAELAIYPTLEGPPTVVPIQAGLVIPPTPLPPGDFGIEVDLLAVGNIELVYTRPVGASGKFQTDIITINIIADAAFPVTWTRELTYRQSGDRLGLDWSVADQVDVSGYTVEADSGNGFEAVTEVAVQGDGSSAEVHYSVVHDWPLTGAYYRIRQDDYSGAFSYSNMIFVPAAESAQQLHVYPNPATHQVRLAVPAVATSVELYQVSGQRIGTYTPEQARQGIDLQALPRGMYLVRALGVNSDGNTQRLLVQD
ncbi:hypothetical protein GGR26_000943 [Lewinella marina]|uniref:Secretion system C-terminal sorting domain-containing protein n=1 Tax=Neolewinella marina TaxID=438751 RepID=A0A2G0CI72_9BACT|nr:T9SS type A sorting domain-containing protein [Neolewinella marina]NJB85198.1 hypothetical protein [Neolewinella marina]PHK99669.1 hypothetical protein CGL56_01060 [Neolewinella marina]